MAVFNGEFGKKFKKTAEADQTKPKTAPEPQASAEQAPPPVATLEEAGSVLAADAKIHGDVEFTGDFKIDGDVQGDVRGGALKIGEKGRIDGSISAEEVSIGGLVTGDVNARAVSVGKTGRVLSSVEYGQLTVEAGAQLNGMITPREAPSVADVVSKGASQRPRSAMDSKAKRKESGKRASRSGIKFAPSKKGDQRPAG